MSDRAMGVLERTRIDRERIRTGLERIRTEPRPHVLALLPCVAVGLLLSWLHWAGLIVGGALVGLVVLGAFALTLGEATWTALEMWPAVAVTAGGAVGLPVLGSLIRGVV